MHTRCVETEDDDLHRVCVNNSSLGGKSKLLCVWISTGTAQSHL